MPRFNLRVYGVCISDGKVLLSWEQFHNSQITKFPGGGLEFGEGLKDCLKREWMEELNCPIKVEKHFYTTDYFQPSAWDNSQVISVYYHVSPEHTFLKLPFNNGIEKFDWRPIDKQLVEVLTLPIDKIVEKKIVEKFKKSNH